MLHFFIPLYREMIRVVCTTLAIVIKDLESLWNNLNLLLKKNAIRFELSAQKGEIGKQTADVLYYQY